MKFLKLYVYLNRVIGITFGGLVFKNNDLILDKNLRFLGNIITFIMILIYSYLSFGLFRDLLFIKAYEEGWLLIYYLCQLTKTCREVLTLINLFYIQTTESLKLFKFLMKYPIKSLKHKVICSCLIIFNYTMVTIFNVILYIRLEENGKSSLYTLGYQLLLFYQCHVISIIQFITTGNSY